jgi:hypothetical protein
MATGKWLARTVVESAPAAKKMPNVDSPDDLLRIRKLPAPLMKKYAFPEEEFQLQTGIMVQSDRNLIVANVANGASQYGIQLQAGAESNVVLGNQARATAASTSSTRTRIATPTCGSRISSTT